MEEVWVQACGSRSPHPLQRVEPMILLQGDVVCITLAAMLKSEEITMEKVLEEIDKNYQELLNKRQAKRA